MAAAAALREGGAVVDTVVCAIDRTDQGSGLLADHDITATAVLTKHLLDTVDVP